MPMSIPSQYLKLSVVNLVLKIESSHAAEAPVEVSSSAATMNWRTKAFMTLCFKEVVSVGFHEYDVVLFGFVTADLKKTNYLQESFVGASLRNEQEISHGRNGP